MTGRLLAIALNTFRENRRDRVLYVLLFFAAIVIVGGIAVGELSPFERAKILLDLGQACMFLIGSMIALFLGNSLLSREIERRTVYAILSKPVSRAEFLVGKVLGLTITLTTTIVLMAMMVTAVAWLYGATISGALLQSFVLIWAETVLIVTLAVAFASFVSSGTLAAMMSISCWIIGQVSADLGRIAERSQNVFGKIVLETVHWVLPNLSLFDVKTRASYAIPIPWPEFGGALLYGLAYSVAMLAAATAVFSRRDFR